MTPITRQWMDRIPGLQRLLSRLRGAEHFPRPGTVRLGDLRRLEPFSRSWGRERGGALDRYYIDGFLERHRGDIRGRVLEIGDDRYTRRFGAEVARIDVLHLEDGHPGVTIVADLTDGQNIPDASFDCVIIPQTFQLIYDVPAAIRTVHRILKPGGVLLSTFPGITHTGDKEWREQWYWSFTTRSAQRLFEEVFGLDQVEVGSYGNVLAATAFLYGLSDRELASRELDSHDPAYDVVITVRAVRG